MALIEKGRKSMSVWRKERSAAELAAPPMQQELPDYSKDKRFSMRGLAIENSPPLPQPNARQDKTRNHAALEALNLRAAGGPRIDHSRPSPSSEQARINRAHAFASPFGISAPAQGLAGPAADSGRGATVQALRHGTAAVGQENGKTSAGKGNGKRRGAGGTARQFGVGEGSGRKTGKGKATDRQF